MSHQLVFSDALRLILQAASHPPFPSPADGFCSGWWMVLDQVSSGSQGGKLSFADHSTLGTAWPSLMPGVGQASHDPCSLLLGRKGQLPAESAADVQPSQRTS